MATSSIFKTFVISGEEAVSNFIDLLYSEPIPHTRRSRRVRDPEEIKEFFEGLEKNLAKMKAEDEAKANEKHQ
ncbi:MAG: hypothetical protein IJM82_07460 [Synergistaceae bacterium]|nr:hypothetical protein [Synergistaceae bacterium]MBQ6435622.1 hypothetical protein [Synergistaceae bacterium]MBQ6738173.1 hypothetical protein [Synergistaceae bacterium]MBQ7068983.1 hypothetical protein [Synergistaceae bacterium]MBR0074286.1 hypothetical protein [Synergistaceae bacterium]